MKYVTVAVLFVIFSIAAILSPLVLLANLLVGRFRQAGHILHSQDMLLAAEIGWDGRSTVSKECGKSTCRFCRAVCWVLHRVLEEKHCEKEAAE